VSQPAVDTSAERLRRWLPAVAAYWLTRWKNVTLQAITFHFSRRYPELVKRLLRKWVGLQLGDKFDLDRHFSPRYNPWDQRLCVAPNGDFFRALRRGDAAIVTDRISAFTAKGIQLESGEHLDADIVVSATGLEMLPFGGIEFTVDDRAMPIPETLAYKGMMLSGLPNLAVAVGYTNASWTLKCDLTSDYVCRLLNYMDRHGYSHCVAMHRDGDVATTPFLDFSSGYITRAIDRFPRQGARSPWRLRQNYLLDLLGLRFASLKDSVIEFHRAPRSDG
jgi:cation diffusion facilitator CzcD-associated flavoprotein CzcO